MTEQSTTQAGISEGIRRRFRFLVVGVIALALLVTAGWFMTSRIYAAAIEDQLNQLSQQGLTIDCAQQAIGGFPARLEVRCSGLTLTDRLGTQIEGGQLTTVAPVWNPSLTIMEWTGPIELAASGFEPLQLDTHLIRSSVRLDRQLNLERLSVVMDPLAINVPSLNTTLSTIEAVEFHARAPEQATQAATDLDIAVLLTGVAGPALQGFEPIDLSLTATANRLASARGSDPRSLFFDWVTRSGEFENAMLLVQSGDQLMRLEGDGRLAGDGAVSFEGTLATNDVAGLMERLGVGNATTSSAIAAGAALFGRQTDIEGTPGTELPLVINNGQISVGPANLGVLPPVQF